MTTFDAINEVLLSLNELPLEVTDNPEDIPTGLVASTHLNIARKKILSSGWYFNTTNIELVPDNDGYIAVPASYLTADHTTDNNIIIRDHKLFDKSDLTFVFDEEQEMTVIEDISFDDIPFHVADYIVQTACLQAYVNVVGNGDDVATRKEAVRLARMEALRDDANKRDGNILEHTFVTTLLDRENL